MNLQLYTINTIDNIKLPSLLFTPKKKTNKVAIFIHGNGSGDTFNYIEENKVVAEYFTSRGVAYFTFNNRGARYIQKFKLVDSEGNKRVEWGGMAFELIEDCIKDIDAAIQSMQQRGFDEIYLIGGSTGANKIVLYNFYKPDNVVLRYVLLSPGDDTGIYFELLGEEKFNSLLKLAKEKIAEGKGVDLLEERFFGALLSYRSLYDTFNPNGNYNIFPYYEAQNKRLGTKELLRELKSVTIPTLVILGEKDEYAMPSATACMKVLQDGVKGRTNFSLSILEDGGHDLYLQYKLLKQELYFLLS